MHCGHMRAPDLNGFHSDARSVRPGDTRLPPTYPKGRPVALISRARPHATTAPPRVAGSFRASGVRLTLRDSGSILHDCYAHPQRHAQQRYVQEGRERGQGCRRGRRRPPGTRASPVCRSRRYGRCPHLETHPCDCPAGHGAVEGATVRFGPLPPAAGSSRPCAVPRGGGEPGSRHPASPADTPGCRR